MKLSFSKTIADLQRTVSKALGRTVAVEMRNVDIEATYTPGDSIFVFHELGEVPSGFAFMQLKGACNVYLEDGDDRGWTENKITVRCDTAGVSVKLALFGNRD